MTSRLPVKEELTHGFAVPTFIQLVVTRRVLCEYFAHNNNSALPSSKMIEALVSKWDINQEQQKHACQILIPLITGNLKTCMEDCYNEEEAALIVVNIMYERIIKRKFSNIYQNIISYHSENDDNSDNNIENNIDENKNDNMDSYPYQYLVFNTSDLFCLIFQWFGIKYQDFNNNKYTYGYDLHCCSLVSFHWLFHVWHSKSTYFVNLTHYIIAGVNANKVYALKIWQRFSSSKSIQIDMTWYLCGPGTDDNGIIASMLNKARFFNKVEKIVGYINGPYLEIPATIVTTILHKCKNKIKCFNVKISAESEKEKKLVYEKVDLPQAEKIYISSVYYAIKWSFKCKYLTLYNDTHHSDLRYPMYLNSKPFTTITKEMCQYIIDNCDCSGVTSLDVGRIKFAFLDKSSSNNNNNNNNNSNSGKLLLKKLAQKFENLKYFLYFDSSNIDGKINYGLEFRKLLQPIILKNNCIVNVMSNTLNSEKIEIKNGDINENGLYTGEETFGDSKWYLSRKLFEEARAHFVEYDRDRDNKLNVKEAWSFFKQAKIQVKILQAVWKMIVTQHNDPQLPNNGLSLIQFYSMFNYTLVVKRHNMEFDQCPDAIPRPIQFNVIRMYLKSAQEINQMADKTIEMHIGPPSMLETIVREDKLRIH